ncbi:preprotein translocase subunit SecE [Alkalibaculum sp. M08DMB]|uniref:Protein translocase subunit SecE n=1 Tax=Alkalibaculum sporogenes TaxID=2655001 RepID=A0A6A7K6S5_9FIRM|nr:preprotein translocase subunit SecE [Alkalibaculum sporogenes]MPW25041.1 preprotein translocase subunit SecE [Alkalibaculum sporogenes]
MTKKEIKKETKKDPKKASKIGIIKRITGFFKSVWFELKKVTWPTRPELMQHTSVVIGIVLIMTIIVSAIDFGLGGILQLIIR